jgi:predicted AlkP superfamily pyrophosphatase or phosphodiesterase
MLAYFTALDHEQHQSGPFSPGALATLERIDAIVGAMTTAASHAYGNDVVIAIVSDHGFRRTDKSLNLISALRSANLVDFPIGADTKPSAWRAMTWADGGSAAVVLRDSTDVATRDRVDQLLHALAADSANGIDRVIDAGELRRRGGYPNAAFLVSLRDGYSFGNDSRGPLVVEKRVGGTHGYLPDVPAMRSSFIIAGPGIDRGRDLGLIDQRAIAPTLAKLLGVRLAGAELDALPLAANTSHAR